ncbi:nuclear transport factor 2 family protein [Paenibacillus amylolyticus]|uniref:Nuclear transport factor 2 family protein n=1 Tax=Paenibacillus amylolyticus TaxID=1451 RepID=A0A5M9WUK7_PAEAM|nr:nuclear transport factor 2 family protein [Paenibacillus amylolyticus]KAA8785324.1 nuclear transport factor 2 family protein [Paenibacillus amylolyticus]
MGHEETLRAYIEATNTHQFDEVSKLLAPNAIYWFTGTSCTTLDEIQNYFEHAWDTVKEEVYRAEDVHWIAVDERQAVCTYTYHWEGYVRGHLASGQGRATNVFVKGQEGAWKLIHEHLSLSE